MKYTKSGKILLGCRRRPGVLSIEIWDTGIGIAPEDTEAIFEEYHQVDNAEHERSRGLGLGLSIVKRLADLLDHRVIVRSQPGKGSVFAVEVALSPGEPGLQSANSVIATGADTTVARTGSVLVVEDEPEMRELLEVYLQDEGHRSAAAPDGPAALDMVVRLRPDLIISDYNLPTGMDGLQVAAELRQILHFQIPVIILTGDISTDALRNIALRNCILLHKPVKLDELSEAIRRLLSEPRLAPLPIPSPAEHKADPARPVVFIVDDDSHIRDEVRSIFEEDGQAVETYADCETFLEAYRPDREGCLLIDAYLPGMSGLELLQKLHNEGDRLPAIMITGNSDVAMAVRAMKAGASDFIEKPIGRSELLISVERALEHARDSSKRSAARESAANRLAKLTRRQRQIMDLVLTGHPSKNIAADLGISQRTVENHRASIMKKTGSRSLPALARLALVATGNGAGQPNLQEI
jgi:two-component system CheB/CheR fusion protein